MVVCLPGDVGPMITALLSDENRWVEWPENRSLGGNFPLTCGWPAGWSASSVARLTPVLREPTYSEFSVTDTSYGLNSNSFFRSNLKP